MSLMETELVRRADAFAEKAHTGQVRKYTGEPYIVHPRSVALTVSLSRRATEYMVAAALLHDVVEDCDVPLEEILDMFPSPVGMYVDDLTKRDHLHPDWKRDRRKAFEAGRLSHVSADSQTIKLADLIDNTRSVIWGGKDFARIYLLEKQVLVGECLTRGDPLLLKIAREQVETGLKILQTMEARWLDAAAA